ncbi:MAG: hypothetical protein MZW92_01210 [Comamonadaceae bacterium]|nr:hypothetical protein [Comamonadaceae bacterium]
MIHALLFSVFVIASCGLAYELIAGALSSYLLGDSVTAVLHRHRRLPVRHGRRLLAVALRGRATWCRASSRSNCWWGCWAASRRRRCSSLFTCLAAARSSWLLYVLVLLIGILVGLEIPLVMRILKRSSWRFKDLVSQVLDLRLPRRAGGVDRCFRCCWRRTWGWSARRCCSACSTPLVALWALWLFRAQAAGAARLRAAAWRGGAGAAGGGLRRRRPA